MEAYSITERIRTWRDAGGNGSKKFVTTCFNLQKKKKKILICFFISREKSPLTGLSTLLKHPMVKEVLRSYYKKDIQLH